MDEVEDRVRKLEEQLIAFRATLAISIKFGAVAGLVALAWLGYTSWISIPTQVDSSVHDQIDKGAKTKIDNLLLDAQNSSDQLARLTANGTITIGGKCYKPRTLIRCHAANATGIHLTFTANANGGCTDSGYEPDGDKFAIGILASC